MKQIAIVTFLVITIGANAQRPDSLISAIDSTRQKINRIQNSLTLKYDSLQTVAKVSKVMDSIKVLSWGDTLRQKVNLIFISDSLGLNHRLDSLRSLGLNARKITKYHEKYLEKISSKQRTLLGEVNGKQGELQKKITGDYNNWQKSIQQKLKLDSMGLKIPGASLNKINNLNVPGQNLNIPNADLPNIPSLPNMPRLDASNFSSLNLSPDLKKIGGNLSLPNATQLGQWDKAIPAMPQFKEYTSRISGYKGMMKDPSKVAENAAKQINEVKDLSNEMSQAQNRVKQNEALKLSEKMKDGEALKDEAKNLAKKEAVNHFKGQEQSLKGAMDQLAKYKKKYSSLNSLSEIKKNDWMPRNGLKGQPLKERFRVGLHTGFQQRKDTLVIDFYPNVSYKFTGRLEAGLGAIYRIQALTSTYTLNQGKSTWGLSSFAILRTFKKTYFRVEVDGNSYVRTVTLEDPSTKNWRWTFLAGVQTNYKLNKSFTGNVQMLFNFDNNLKDKFPEALTLRVGVQYRLPGKKESKSK